VKLLLDKGAYTHSHSSPHSYADTTSSPSHGIRDKKEHVWHCCQCGGENSYELSPGCTNYGQRGYCGHWVEGCAVCVVEEVRPPK
jgi:hypothetical protein